jgi:mannose-6-phosphate isomerase-like protein (cupin superfamily)
MTRICTIDLDELRTGPTAALFEGGPHAGTGTSMFIVRTPPGRFVELHTHPYAETFVLLAGSGRWTAGETILDIEAEHVISVPAETLHGFRNTGSVPLLVVSVHESPTLIQTFTDQPPA